MPGRKGACIEEIAAPEFAIFGNGLEVDLSSAFIYFFIFYIPSGLAGLGVSG